jgi:outer membrane protein OmpA-like peptidoglycan-associated protein
MTIDRHNSRSLFFLAAVGVVACTVAADRVGLIQFAQAQQGKDDDAKKDKKGPPPPKKAPPPPPPPKAPPPPPKAPPPPPKVFAPPPEKKAPQFQPAPKIINKAPEPKKEEFKKKDGPPPGFDAPPKKGPPPPPKDSGVDRKGPPPKEFGFDKKGPPPKEFGFDKKGPPPFKGPPPQQGTVPFKKGGPPEIVSPGPQGPRFKRLDEVQKGRQERVEDGGRRRVIQEPGNRVILKQDNRAIIRHDEAERFRRRPDARSERRSDGTTETVYVRPDGVRIYTVVDGNGRLIRRYRRGPDGVERNFIDNRRFYRNLAIGVGIGALGIVALNLAPPRVTIPRDEYIVDYDRASDDDFYAALSAPPIEDLERSYSLEEIRDNYELRQRLRRIDLPIGFEFGSFEVGQDQLFKLERIARSILRVLERYPDDVIFIEGHTDAIGGDVDNLSLSDRRASAVAEILTETFGVPAENLVTQGYGEQHLKIDTQDPEVLNRRVSVINVSKLMER